LSILILSKNRVFFENVQNFYKIKIQTFLLVKFIKQKSLVITMVDVANTVALPGFLETVRSVIGVTSYVLGGIFGVYLILILVRWWQNRIVIRLLKDVKYNLEQQNRKLKIPHSGALFESKMYHSIRAIFEKQK